MMDLSKITGEIASVIKLLEPVIGMIAPEAMGAITIGSRIIQGVVAAEPVAVELFNRIQSGASVTDADLARFWQDYQSAHDQLEADIAAKLANPSAGP